ncbi:MAG: CotH kinase family protein [Flavobacteriales bacterium]|nr:CotH kinase family protein [Flavobacteriales bacterium]
MTKRWRWLLLILVLGLGAAWYADRRIKAHGHPGLVTFGKQWWRNYPKSFAMDPPVVSIEVDEAGMEQFYGVVDRARAVGVIGQEGNDYVDGRFHVEMPGGSEGTGDFKGKLRIKGKMTDHVEGDKWSFRVVAKKSGGFLGMKRFSLQHPGTRNYLCDWFFHQLMKGEGIIALRYGFCKVKLNDEDLGVYAYEEHFGPELLENNGRLPGPIVRFDPGLFWLHRTQGLDGGAKVDDAYGAYQAASLDAFGTDDIAQDAQQKRYFEQAIALMDGFRRGRLKASEVFDVERTGKRLAMLDLVGGHHSMDWSDVKFYFDPVAQRLEPISYESFSANPTVELAGAYQATGAFNESDDLHTAFFKDPEIFAAYVRDLERYSRQEWLDSAFAALKGAIDTASATLYGEFPYKELDRSVYYANQRSIRALLDTPKGFHAYDNGLKGDTLTLALVPIESLPMQVDSLVLRDGQCIAPLTPTVLPCRRIGSVGEPMEVAFPAKDDSAAKVIYHVLGASERKELEVFPFKLSISGAQDELLASRKPNAPEFGFLAVDDVARTITIKPGAWKVDRTMVLPAGYRCVASAPLELDIVNGAEIISYAMLDWKGQGDEYVEVFSTDSSSHGVHVIDAVGTSTLDHVSFRSLTRYKYDQERSGDVSFHKSDVTFKDVFFRGTGATLFDASSCTVTMEKCWFEGGSDQAEFHFADVSMREMIFQYPGDDAVSIEGGQVNAKKIAVAGKPGPGIGIKGTRGARLIAEGLTIERMGQAFEGREGSKLFVTDAEVKDVDLVAEAKKKEMRYGPVVIELNKVTITNAKQDFKKGEESIINVDGKKVGEKSAGGT